MADGPISESEAIERCECKLGETAWKYDRMSMIAEVGNKWARTPDDEGISAATLSKEFNREIITAAMERAGETPLDGAAENYRRILMEDPGVDTATVTEAEAKLSEIGVNVKALKKSLIGTTTTHSHLVDCLGLEYENPKPAPEASIHTINNARAQFESNIERALRQQDLDDEVGRISISANVVCASCGDIYEAGAFISDGGCDCQE